MKTLILILLLLTSFGSFSQSNHEYIKGHLIIIGGGGVPNEIISELKYLMGGPDKKLIVIPTAATSDPISKERLEAMKNNWIERGFPYVEVLHTHDREVANSYDFYKSIREASAIWFTGGRQWRLADSYLGTKTHEAIHDLIERGGVVAGSSAGATIQGSYLARGDTKTNTVMVGDHEEGLGLLNNVAIDQHLLARNRQFDMFEILDKDPELLGIGLDEGTAIVVHGNSFRVIGKSYVAIYDGTRWSAERDTIYQLPKGSHDFYFLRAGDEYDLIKRSVIQRKDRKLSMPVVQNASEYIGQYSFEGDIIELLLENDSLKAIHYNMNNRKYHLLQDDETNYLFPPWGNSFLMPRFKDERVIGLLMGNTYYSRKKDD